MSSTRTIRRSRSDALRHAYNNFSNFILSLPENANHVATNVSRRFSNISRSSRSDGRVVPFTTTATNTANPLARGLARGFAKRKRNNLTKKRRK